MFLLTKRSADGRGRKRPDVFRTHMMRNGAYRADFITLSIVTDALLPIIFTTVRRPSEGGNGESPCFISLRQGDFFAKSETAELSPKYFYIRSLEYPRCLRWIAFCSYISSSADLINSSIDFSEAGASEQVPQLASIRYGFPEEAL